MLLSASDDKSVRWSEFNSGAAFTSSCDFNFVNRHLSFSRAKSKFGFKFTDTDMIKLNDGTILQHKYKVQALFV